jgi:hypothetical protein
MVLRRGTPISAAACLLLGLVAAGCLPPPTAVTTGSPPASGPASAPSDAAPTPSPSAKAQDQAIAEFVSSVAAGKLTYRVAFDGDLRASISDAPVAGSMDVSGADFASSITYGPGGPGIPKVRVLVRGVDGKGWIKRGSSGWQSIKNFGPAQSYVPFKAVKAPTDVRYLGTAKVGGKTFYRIVVNDALLIHPNTIPYVVRDAQIEDSEIEFLIDADGRPSSGKWTLRAKARVGGSGQLQRVVYDLHVTFSNVGGKLSVKRP